MPIIYSGPIDAYLAAGGYSAWAKAAEGLRRQDCHPRSIEGRLTGWSELIVWSGVIDGDADTQRLTNSPKFQLLIKALRMKRFGRCPACDGNLAVWENRCDRCTEIRCDCGLKAQISDRSVLLAEHPDDVLVNLCRPYVDGLTPKEA